MQLYTIKYLKYKFLTLKKLKFAYCLVCYVLGRADNQRPASGGLSDEEQQAVANMVSAGLGVSGGFRLGSARVQTRGLVSWKHDLDGGDAVARQSLGISDSLDVYGAGRESSSLELDAGLDVRFNPDARLGITYSELDVLDAGGRDGHFKAVLEFSM